MFTQLYSFKEQLQIMFEIESTDMPVNISRMVRLIMCLSIETSLN